MTDGLTYRAEVRFLEGCNPALVERNADEFKRLHDMLVAVDEPAERAQKRTQWHSEGSVRYETRLAEVRELMAGMAAGYGRAAGALRSYAWALETAEPYYANGKANEQALASLIGTKGTAVTRDAREAEPMRQWEDMRATTGALDFLAEPTMDVDDITDTIREQADAPWGLSPVAIQVRRGAEVLGYDLDHLTEQQRSVVEEALQDPGQNIFIAAGYLAQLKAESEFADVPAQEMTPAQYQELAARYNGGPYWQGEDAQAYGRGFARDLDDARRALG
ncbi:hypothetical protein [Streptomyces sp. G1]|uniref:hypothetical protein n=1 Tax=Streptomyces sp. G1 TaxID=361572 RepID=UPI00202F456F|nr:hypothetical protein [Streptomyces sp. G1]MCM1967917.1 hypothetical protein [Streptomyces sp. G1]